MLKTELFLLATYLKHRIYFRLGQIGGPSGSAPWTKSNAPKRFVKQDIITESGGKWKAFLLIVSII